MMIDKTLFDDYLNALLGGHRSRCRQTVEQLIGKELDIKDIYTDLFQRSLYRVGELWETNKISVATEHMATAITDGLLSLVYPQIFAADHTDKKAVISCIANEWHQIGGKMAADIFELNGWDGHFLGANTPLTDLLAFIDEVQPDVLGLSLSLRSNFPILVETAEAVRAEFKDLDLFFGGQALRWGGLEKLAQMPNSQLIFTLHELEKNISG